MNIKVGVFKRTKEAKWETALFINSGEVLIDQDGHVVTGNVYDIKDHPDYFSLEIGPVLKSLTNLYLMAENAEDMQATEKIKRIDLSGKDRG